MNYEFSHIDFPPRGSDEERADLNSIIYQFYNRRNPESIQEAMDEDMVSVFEAYILNKGYNKFNRKIFDELIKVIVPIIIDLKYKYKRERPQKTAERLGIKISFDNMPSSESPSYPSGHTIQSFTIAYILSKIYTDEANELYQLAEMIAQSRIDRGVHFPSDVSFGKKIAFELCSQGFCDQFIEDYNKF